jgi:hypothetical protein
MQHKQSRQNLPTDVEERPAALIQIEHALCVGWTFEAKVTADCDNVSNDPGLHDFRCLCGMSRLSMAQPCG